MKFAVVCFAVFGLAAAIPAPRSGLKDDVDDFLALIPKEQFVALYHKYENDADIQKIVAYLKSQDFANVMHIIATVDEVQSLVRYLEGQGVPVIDLLNRIADRLGLPHWPGSYKGLAVKSTRSLREFLDEAKALIPINDLAALAIDKLSNSVAFQELYMKISSLDYQKLHDQALSHPEIQDMIDRITAMGVDVKKVWETVKSIFGWSRFNARMTKSLKDDLDDFLALIPKEKFVALYHKYENDADMKKIVAYLKSNDFASVMHIIAGVDEVRDLVNYLEGQGIPVVDLLNRIADRLGLPHWPSSYNGYTTMSTRSIRDFINEAKALLPINDLAALAIDKLSNSEAFQELYMRIASVDYQKLHDQALSHPEIQDMIDRLTALGVDVKKVWETVKSIFGWSRFNLRMTKSLKDDLDDFLALIPKEKFVALYHKYENDADMKKIVAYLKSNDFASVMHIIAGVDEVRDLVNYLEGQGIPVVDLLNRIADRLGLPHWPSSYTGFTTKSTRSIRDFINEAKALLPINDLAALAIDKLSNSEAFQELYMKIASVDYQKLHDQALSHPEIQDMIDRLTALGVDVKKVWETVKSIFGWSRFNLRMTKSLKDDLDDFLVLIPKEKFVALYHKYENDADMKKIVAYLKSNDFASVMHIIAGVDEVRDLVNYLEGQGIPVVDLLNRIADRLGLPHWPSSYTGYTTKSTRSIRDFINEAKALLPINDLAALAIDKLSNSEAFQELYMRIASVDYQKLHDQALSHPEIQDMIDRLSALGVDVKKVWETVKSIFGWSRFNLRMTKSLRSDLDDFLALIPKEQLVDLYHKYQNDDDIKRIVAYLKSQDFAKVVHIVAGVEEIRSLVNYLEGKGVAVIDLLNRIADRLGLPHWTVYGSGYTRVVSRTWRDFLEEAKALVPVDDIVALAIDKLANSPDFQELYMMIASVDYQKLHNQAIQHAEIRDMLSRLAAMGVDTKKVWEFVKSIFGWN